jgi:hypothetical protein
MMNFSMIHHEVILMLKFVGVPNEYVLVFIFYWLITLTLGAQEHPLYIMSFFIMYEEVMEPSWCLMNKV